VVSSPREVTVMLDKNAPGIFNGVIEVESFVADRPALKVPVVRYAPPQHTAARRARRIVAHVEFARALG
jgi:hypothetical protein